MQNDDQKKKDAAESDDVVFVAPVKTLSPKDVALVAGGENNGPKGPGGTDNQQRKQ